MNTIHIYKDLIKTTFIKCATLKELVQLLNQIDVWRYENKHWKHQREVVTVKAVKYYLYGKKNKYSTFTIAKKSGGTRTISSPDQFLRKLQRLLNICFNSCFTPMPTATGFVEGRSIVDNAKKHTGKKYVYNIDLKDFFPSIQFARIRAVLTKVPPFKLHPDIAHIVANLCCFEGVLPQGAPTSPTLSNFVCKRLDAKLYYLARDGGFIFSRYADDITISSNKNIYTVEFKKQLFDIIESEGFQLNPKKERLQRNNVKKEDGYIRERQEVTGIIVNEKPNVPRHFTRNLRATLDCWYKKGYVIASTRHQYYYKREKGFLKYKGQIPALEDVVGGKIEYLGMVRGKEDDTYRWMKLKFDELCMKQSYSIGDFEEVFALLESDDVKKAADYFYNKRNLTEANG